MSRNILLNFDLEKLFSNNDYNTDKVVAVVDIASDIENEVYNLDNEDKNRMLNK